MCFKLRNNGKKVQVERVLIVDFKYDKTIVRSLKTQLILNQQLY